MHQPDFIRLCIELGVLRFGEFKLKSGRLSPYFFNAGLFNTGHAIAGLGRCYARAAVLSGLDFDMLSDLCAADYLGYPDREGPRFEVVYHLLSSTHLHRVRVKAGVPEVPAQIDSCVEVWPAANWLEREVFDLYGIRFRNHPDLRRLLLYEEFEGHPLRKDYPKERRQPLVGPRN